MNTIYNNNRIAIIKLDNGDLRIDKRNFKFGTNNCDGIITSIIIPYDIANNIDFSNLKNINN
tara:strand:+ start:1749 stop:1934 length:186 start_codon:yes stop_codon:yes gene_type:complete